MNEIIKKFLETISLTKEQWIVILSSLLLILAISGTIYIKTLSSRIESLEENIVNWKDMVKYHKDNYKIILEEHEKEIDQLQSRVKIEVEAEFYKSQYENAVKTIKN